ncbi:hypothetical protein HPB50_010443 [Hyalomma asiaticum]|uniref:Uncharacterized protein n=1 Tax=Hyalomma asiaticum TaxID=266040 RepID=A0ACB7T0D8_HYAAI|nr:hypothetical protein HPB50_010443 [Hyalomma asiaticum]
MVTSLFLFKTFIVPTTPSSLLSRHRWRVFEYGLAVCLSVRQEVKKLLHLPASFPDFIVHIPHRAGGLGESELSRVSAEIQVKCLARLQRGGSPTVDAVLGAALDGFRRELEEKMGVTSGIVEAPFLNAALRDSRQVYLEDVKGKYTNKSLFAVESDPIGNRWLWPDARYMADGDRIKALRLRSNLFPTRTLSNRHSKYDSARPCRRCHQAPETIFHILQTCEAVHEPRCSRHNFISKAIVNKLQSRHKDAVISTDRLLVAADGTRLRPDIVVDLKDRTFVLDVAVAWDARTDNLEAMCTHKIEKYLPLVPILQKRHPFRPVTVLGLAFGARGLICPSTKRAPKEIRRESSRG